MRVLIGFLVLVAILASAGMLVARYFKPSQSDLPTVSVHRGDMLVKTYTRGELRAVTSALVVAPNIGGTLLISKMAATGTRVEKDEPVLAFDPAEQQNNVAMNESRVSEAEQEITKIKADVAVRTQQEKVDLMKAEFAVRRAELDVSRNELVSEIDAKKNLLVLEAARKKLAQLREDIESRQRTSDAELAMAKEKYNKAALDLKQANERLNKINIKSSITGLVSARQNRFATGGMWFPGIDVPDYRVGDQAFDGDTVLDVVSTEQMEVLGKVNEVDRGNLKEGQEVSISVDGIAGEVFPGKLKTLSGMASQQFFADPTKTFDVVFTLQKQDARLRPGVNAEVEVITERMKGVVYVPAQAVFEKEGKKWVYVQNDGRFSRREVETARRSESQVMIAKGLSGGEIVSLLDPEDRSSQTRRSNNPLSNMGRRR